MKKKKGTSKKESSKDFLFNEIKSEVKDGEIVEGMIVRPMILLASFISFIGAMFLLLIGNLMLGGSFIVFGFVLNLYSIYQSLEDEKSIFRTMNLIFKLVLFLSEIIVFNWLITTI